MVQAQRELQERFLEAVAVERQRLSSRRGFLLGSAKLAGGAALAMTAIGVPTVRGFKGVVAQDAPFADDVAVLNYALTLEHLEYAFYRDGLDFFLAEDFDEGVYDNLTLIRDHEGAHVTTLTDVIGSLGGTPVAEATYDFGYGEDPLAFLEVAAALENTGVAAYDGAGQYLADPGLLTAAGGIVAVEARHASYLNELNGEIPFPDAFETPLTPDEVLAIAGPFIVA